MKPTYIALLALCLCLAGCGKKEVEKAASKEPELRSKKVITPDEAANELNAGDKLWEFVTGGWVTSSPAIGSDGTVYVGSGSYLKKDNKLYAIKTDSKGLGKSPWPMRGQNARRTGRQPKPSDK